MVLVLSYFFKERHWDFDGNIKLKLTDIDNSMVNTGGKGVG